ncbi:MAG: class I SAM-dependent methyltransferase [Deltaproteobacteria bacterium]|nr:class I SAM-dependent methyltransferase [Deltaproteobacteria bacterium]
MGTLGTHERQQLQEEQYQFPYHYLDLRVPEYDLFFHVEYVSYLNLVKERLAPFYGQLVLDVGCGDGRFCHEMRDENVRMIGVDISEKALRFARAFSPDFEFICTDVCEMSLSDTPDAVVLIETLEHIPPDQIPRFVARLARLVRVGGRLVVTVPSVHRPLIAKHFQHFTEESLRAVFEDDFEMIECVGYARRGLHWAIFARTRGLLRRLLIGWLDKSRSIRALFTLLKEHQVRHFGIGNPEECAGLVAVFERKVQE